MADVENLAKEIGFKPGDNLTVEQMTALLDKGLDNDRLYQVASMIKNFAPVASAALEGMAKTALAAGKVDEAIAGALRQAIVELGRYHADDNPEVRRMSVEKISEITGYLFKIHENSDTRSKWVISAVGALALAMVGAFFGSRNRIA